MNAFCKLISQRSWPAAVVASLAAHLVVLSLAARTVHTAETAERRPPVDHPMLRGSSPIPVALVTGRPVHQQAEAGLSAVQAIGRISRGRGRAHHPMPGPTPALPNSATGREAVSPSETNLALGDTPITEDTSDESGSAGEQGHSASGSGEITSGQSGSSGHRASPGVTSMPERIAELHQRLASSARRCYPPAARRLRLRGEVGLYFCLGADGFAESRALRGSTGSALLDRASLDCVLAGALPAPGIGGCYDVQVRFSDER